MRWGSVVVVAALVLSVAVSGCSGPAAMPRGSIGLRPSTPSGVMIDGDVREPHEITRFGLEKSPGLSTVTVEWTNGRGVGARTERHTERGLDLTIYEIAYDFDPGPAGTALQSFAVLAVGADGTTAVFTYGEFGKYGSNARLYGDNTGGVLLSYDEDGTGLQQPRLIVRGDQTGQRCVRDVVELRVVRLA